VEQRVYEGENAENAPDPKMKTKTKTRLNEDDDEIESEKNEEKTTNRMTAMQGKIEIPYHPHNIPLVSPSQYPVVDRLEPLPHRRKRLLDF